VRYFKQLEDSEGCEFVYINYTDLKVRLRVALSFTCPLTSPFSFAGMDSRLVDKRCQSRRLCRGNRAHQSLCAQYHARVICWTAASKILLNYCPICWTQPSSSNQFFVCFSNIDSFVYYYFLTVMSKLTQISPIEPGSAAPSINGSQLLAVGGDFSCITTRPINCLNSKRN